MNKVTLIFSMLIYSFGTYSKECDPENRERFFKVCSSSTQKMKETVQQLPLWEGTDYSGHQLLDCNKGWLKNIIDETGESYACEITIKRKKSLFKKYKKIKSKNKSKIELKKENKNSSRVIEE